MNYFAGIPLGLAGDRFAPRPRGLPAVVLSCIGLPELCPTVVVCECGEGVFFQNPTTWDGLSPAWSGLTRHDDWATLFETGEIGRKVKARPPPATTD